MRDVPRIWEAWRSGAFVGDNKPVTRVTVEVGWELRTTDPTVGTWARGPARWFVQQGHSPDLETEIPAVSSVNITRSLDADSGSCDVIVRNVIMPALGEPEVPVGQFGNIGALTWDHGLAQDAVARWGHTTNEWLDVLAPNALIRTYQGFGGDDKPLADAIADGNLVLNGVWLVDDVVIETEGTISIRCRDMAKLLLDQQLFPPLVPENLYPLLYKRWDIRITAIPADQPPQPFNIYASNYGICGPAPHSSTDEYYGEYNTRATGHAPGEAFDISYESADAVQAVTPGYFAHQRTFWLSEPRGAPTDTVWVEFCLNGGEPTLINQIYYHPYGWNYWIQVSVHENGEWVMPQTPEGGMTAQGIPFVTAFAPRHEAVPGTDTNLYPLNRDYKASRIRLTISNLQWMPEGGYRAGIRKAMAAYDDVSAIYPNLTFAGVSIPVNSDIPPREGYWQVRSNGEIYAFGDARTYPANSPNSAPKSTVVAMAVHPSGNGYWLLDVTGRVTSYGEATWHGDFEGWNRVDFIDIAPSPTGDGYWLLAKNGEVADYGDAIPVGNSTHNGTLPVGVASLARSIESHPTAGVWVLWDDGFVDARGGAPHYGNANRNGFTHEEWVTRIVRNSTGSGYWVLSGSGIVQNFGAAGHYGNAAKGLHSEWYRALTWDLLTSSKSDAGYMIQNADGLLQGRGEVTGFGSIGAGEQRMRYDGNYKDYSDIIRELLLWSGYYLYRSDQPPAEMPDIYGNLETTGAWADEPLPADMFDKRPVMDAIKQIRDIVGYVFFIDAEGGARWESPNWWTLGNFLIDGSAFATIPEIDETLNLTSYSLTRSAQSARSKIIIANSNPMPGKPGEPSAKDVVVTEITPRTAPDLRGLVVPAMWINQAFLKKEEQRIMADLIDLRAWMARRTAQVTCVANPLIDINDQVRIIERQTGEVHVHYVRGVTFNHDLESGAFTMTLTTHWLGGTPYGPEGEITWAITADRALDNTREAIDKIAFQLSSDVVTFLKGTSSPSALNAAVSGFSAPLDVTYKALP